MRIAFVMHSPEYLRFYGGVIDLLAERGHEIVMGAVKRSREGGIQLSDLQRADGRISSRPLLKRKDLWGPLARAVRGTMDFVRYLDPEFAEARALRARLKRKGLPRPLHFLDRLGPRTRAGVHRVQRLLRAAEQAIPVDERTVAWIRRCKADLVLVSSLVEPASGMTELIKAARRMGIPSGVCIASWDNLTNKGLVRIVPDRLLVWNEIQRREAVELHGVPRSRVVATGAPSFDPWFGRRPLRDAEQLRAEAGLGTSGSYLLFVGSSAFITRPGEDVALVRQWLVGLRAPSAPQRLRDLPVIVRPHPYNCVHWADVDLSEFGDAVVWPRSFGRMTDAPDRNDYFDTLYHSAAVVGINTSAMIEAAILGKPVHSILAPEFSDTQEGTLHFHYLLPENGGFLWVASSLGEHYELLARSLEPDASSSGAGFVGAFVRPRGVDRPCTPILADEIEETGRLEVVATSPSVTARLLRFPLLPLAAAAKWGEARRKGKPALQALRTAR